MQTSKLTIRPKDDLLSLFKFVQEYAKIGIWEFDLVTSELIWSDQTRKIHEAPVDYVPNVDEGIAFYKKGYSRNTITEVFTKCIESHESYDVELEIKTWKGNFRWVRAIGMPIVENGACVKVQGLFQDIHEKTVNALELAAKEEQLRLTFDHALVGMAILDLDGYWMKVNKSLCKIFGYKPEEFLKLSFADITHPDDVSKGKNAIFDMIGGKTDYFQTEKRYVSKDKKIISAYLSCSLVKNSKGKPLFFIAQISDLTQINKDKRRIENLLKKTENQNGRLLNFAHIVSHNLRSHYSNLDMLIDISKIEVPEATQNEIFPLFEQAVHHLGETVDNLNEVASINTKKDIEIVPINLFDSFDRIAGSIAAQVLESRAKLCMDISKEIFIEGIPAYLDSILLNLVTNAIKYSKPNEAPKIEVKALNQGNNIVIMFKDHGQGIDLNKHGHKLFGMYKTFHKHKDSRGLGLFITKNQVEALGGKIEVESQVNIGTTFKVYLKKHEKN